ncbi:DUF397 domain-containing protein [Streptomyces sp. NA04227]|uniref:DUF397 domain-containing protein n=1 Tax=Streptomyces sp. NA04227 TaxID=2742136 RepID=UPI0034CE7867
MAQRSASLTWFKSSYSAGDGGECLEVALDWRKSTHSAGDGGQCLEVAAPWRKSSHSSGEGGACLEISPCPAAIHIRDSKNKSGPMLSLPAAAWSAFVGYASRSEIA